jgi:Flp pilus assembly protein TadB
MWEAGIMPQPSTPGPDDSRALSARERQILADIEHDLDASSPALAREMARLTTTRTPPVPAGVVDAAFLIVSLFLVLAVAGLVPGVVWALLAVIGAMVIVPWVMLRAFEKFEREPNDTQE